MSSKKVWVVLSGLLVALGACQRNYSPMVPANGGPVTLTVTASSTAPVTATLTHTCTPTLSPTYPVTFTPTGSVPVTLTPTMTNTYPATQTATFLATQTVTVPVTFTSTPTPTPSITGFQLTKSESDTQLTLGQPITYTLSYTQNGGPVSNVILYDTVPTGINFVTHEASSSGVTFAQNGSLLTWSFLGPVSNASGTVNWVGMAVTDCSATGPITNIALITGSGMAPVQSNVVVAFFQCSTSTPTTIPTDSPTATASVSFTPTVSIPTPSCAGATVLGSTSYSTAVSVLGGTVDYVSNGAGNSGTVTTLHFYSPYGGGPAVVGLYSDNGFQPGTLLSSSGSVSVAAGWNTVTLNNPVNIVGGNNYWLAIGAQSFLFVGGGTYGSAHLVQNTSSLPAIYGGGAATVSGWLAIYADICPDVTVTPTASTAWTWTPTDIPTSTPTITPTDSPTGTAPLTQTATDTPTCACTGGTPTLSPTVTWTPTPLTCTQASVWGDAVTAASPVSLFAGNTSCQKYALAQDSVVSRIYFDVVSYLPTASMAAGIYADGGSYPGDLVWSSAFQPVTTGWNSIDVSQVQLGTGNFWLALATDQFVMLATAANSTSVRTRETALFQNPFIQLGGPWPTPMATPPPLSTPPDVAALYADICY